MDLRGTKKHVRNASRIQPLSACNVLSIFNDIFMKLKNVEKKRTLKNRSFLLSFTRVFLGSPFSHLQEYALQHLAETLQNIIEK